MTYFYQQQQQHHHRSYAYAYGQSQPQHFQQQQQHYGHQSVPASASSGYPSPSPSPLRIHYQQQQHYASANQQPLYPHPQHQSQHQSPAIQVSSFPSHYYVNSQQSAPLPAPDQSHSASSGASYYYSPAAAAGHSSYAYSSSSTSSPAPHPVYSAPLAHYQQQQQQLAYAQQGYITPRHYHASPLQQQVLPSPQEQHQQDRSFSPTSATPLYPRSHTPAVSSSAASIGEHAVHHHQQQQALYSPTFGEQTQHLPAVGEVYTPASDIAPAEQQHASGPCACISLSAGGVGAGRARPDADSALASSGSSVSSMHAAGTRAPAAPEQLAPAAVPAGAEEGARSVQAAGHAEQMVEGLYLPSQKAGGTDPALSFATACQPPLPAVESHSTSAGYLPCANARCPSLLPPHFGAPIPSPAWATLLPCGCALCRECIHLTLTAARSGGEAQIPERGLDLTTGSAAPNFACLSCGRQSCQFGPLANAAPLSGLRPGISAAAPARAGQAASAEGDFTAASTGLLASGGTAVDNDASWTPAPSAPRLTSTRRASLAGTIVSPLALPRSASALGSPSPPSRTTSTQQLDSPSPASRLKQSLAPLSRSGGQDSKSSPELSIGNFPSILLYSSEAAPQRDATKKQRKSMPLPASDSEVAISSSASEGGDSPIAALTAVLDSPSYFSLSSALVRKPATAAGSALIPQLFLDPNFTSSAAFAVTGPSQPTGGRKGSRALEIKDPKSGKAKVIAGGLAVTAAGTGSRAVDPAGRADADEGSDSGSVAATVVETDEVIGVLDALAFEDERSSPAAAGENGIREHSESEMEHLLAGALEGDLASTSPPENALRPLPPSGNSDSYAANLRILELEERHSAASTGDDDPTALEGSHEEDEAPASPTPSLPTAEEIEALRDEDVTPPPPSKTGLLHLPAEQTTPTAAASGRPIAPYPRKRFSPSMPSPTIARPAAAKSFVSLARRQRTVTSSSTATASSATFTPGREELRDPRLPARFLDAPTERQELQETARRESWGADPWTGKKMGGDQLSGASWPVLKVHNISFHTTIADIEAWLPPGLLPPLSHAALSIHILCSPDPSTGSGKTLPYAYIECISPAAADALVRERDEHWLAGRQVKFRPSSQRQLLADLFGTALKRKMPSGLSEYEQRKWWRSNVQDDAEGKPLLDILGGKSGQGADTDVVVQLEGVSFFTQKDQDDLEALIRSIILEHAPVREAEEAEASATKTDGAASPSGPPAQRHFIKPEERPFARLASVISKYPWHALVPLPEEVNRLYACLQLALKSVYAIRDKMPYAHDIAAMLVRAGLNCPGFGAERKLSIQEAWEKIKDHLPINKPEYSPPRRSFHPRQRGVSSSTSAARGQSSSSPETSFAIGTPDLSLTSASSASTSPAYSPITPIHPSAAGQARMPQESLPSNSPSAKPAREEYHGQTRVFGRPGSFQNSERVPQHISTPASRLTSQERAFPNGSTPISYMPSKQLPRFGSTGDFGAPGKPYKSPGGWLQRQRMANGKNAAIAGQAFGTIAGDKQGPPEGRAEP